MPCRHPAGLLPLCLLVASERFAATLLSALLMFRLTDAYGFSPGVAAELQAVFLGCTYGLAVGGGVLADRWLGYRRALAMGLVCLAFGYLLLGVKGRICLFGGLVCLAVGHGLFKLTAAALVGALYPGAASARAQGFAWFYFSVNVAAVAGPTVAALPLRGGTGWHWAMMVAAWSTAVSLTLLLLAGARLPEPQVVAEAGRPNARTWPRPLSNWAALFFITIAVGIAYCQSDSTLLLFARDRLGREVYGLLLRNRPPDPIFHPAPSLSRLPPRRCS